MVWPRAGRNGGWPAEIVLQVGVWIAGRTRSSWVRKVMASLVKTLRKVVLDPTRTDEHAGVDLPGSTGRRGQAGNLDLLGGQPFARLPASACGRSRRPAARAPGRLLDG